MAGTWLDDVIAPSLLRGIDVNKPVPPQFHIVWEELLGQVPQVPVSAPSGSPNDYAGFIVEEDIDSLLLEASQVFERVNVEGSDELDELFLQASQSYESEHCVVSGMPNVPVTRSSHGGERKVAASGPSSRYGSPKSAKAVEKVRKSAVPKKTRLNTEWAEKTWRDWALYHLENLSQDEMGSGYELLSEFTTMSVPAMNYWLGKFVLEVRTKSGKEYCL